MKNREFRALMAIALMTALIAGSVSGVSGTAYAKENQTITAEASKSTLKSASSTGDTAGLKDETVYAKVDAAGNVKTVTVSDQLKNIGRLSEVKDISVLKDIENVKGDEVFAESGDSLIWNPDNKDICYQGTTNKALPVGIEISYKLDGQNITADELEGKSGHVAIRYEYKNTTKDNTEDYVPFLMVTGLIMDSEKFSNLTITNGKIISDGDRNMAVGMGLPQMKENLGVDDLDIPDYFEVEADVTEYEAVEGITIATNSLFNEIGTDKFDSLSDLKSSMGQLQDASAQLVSGSGELKDGLDVLLSSSGTLIDGVSALADGGNTLTSGAGTLLDGSKTLASGSNSLAKGTGQLLEGTTDLKDGAQQVAAGAASITSQTGKDSELARGAENLTSGIGALGISLNDNLGKLSTGVEDLGTGIHGISDGTKGLQKAIEDNKSTVTNALESVKTAAQNLSQSTSGTNGTSVSAYDVAYGNGGTDSALNTLNALLAREDIPEDAKASVSAAIAALQSDQGARQTSAGTLDAEINAQRAALDNASSAASSAQDVVDAANAASNAFEGYTRAISSATANLISGIGKLSEGADTLQKSISGSASQVTDGIAQLDAGSKKLSGGIGALNNGLNTLSAGASEVNAGSQMLNEKMADADSGAKSVASGASQLSTGASQLHTGALTLSNGIGTLQSGSGALLDGVQQLADGAGKLNEGMIQFNEEGIEKLVGIFDGDINGLLEKLNTMLDASKSYKNFSGISDGMDGEVKFVFVNDK